MNTAQRKKLQELMDLTVAHEPQINYPLHDIRGPKDWTTFRMSEIEMRRALATGQHLMMDCSQGATCLFKWAGLEDPNGLDYRWAGYTGTLLANLPHYSDKTRARVGALVVYGPSTGEHVSMVYRAGKDPLLWSHGFDGGPQLIRLSKQCTYHHLPITFLNVSGIGPVK